jgi:hypothetical protein
MNLSFGEYYSEHMVKHEIFFQEKKERKEKEKVVLPCRLAIDVMRNGVSTNHN